MYRNNSLESNLESYGIFGEVYFDLSDRLTLTGGLRYNNDKKDVTARTTLISFLNPYANDGDPFRSEEHTSELQSLMRISYAVFCLKKKKTTLIKILHTR